MLRLFDSFRFRNVDNRIILGRELLSLTWCKALVFDIEFHIWQLTQIFFLVFITHFSARQKFATIKVIHKHDNENKNRKMHATGSFNYKLRSFVKFKKSSVNRNLNWLNTKSWALSEVFRMKHSQTAEHTLRKTCFDISNNDLIDSKACGNEHYLSVLSFSISFSSNMLLNSSDILSILFIVFDQLRSDVQKQKVEASDHSTRFIITQSFKNEKIVEEVIEILLAKNFFFYESIEFTKALRTIQKKMIFSTWSFMFFVIDHKS